MTVLALLLCVARRTSPGARPRRLGVAAGPGLAVARTEKPIRRREAHIPPAGYHAPVRGNDMTGPAVDRSALLPVTVEAPPHPRDVPGSSALQVRFLPGGDRMARLTLEVGVRLVREADIGARDTRRQRSRRGAQAGVTHPARRRHRREAALFGLGVTRRAVGHLRDEALRSPAGGLRAAMTSRASHLGIEMPLVEIGHGGVPRRQQGTEGVLAERAGSRTCGDQQGRCDEPI